MRNASVIRRPARAPFHVATDRLAHPSAADRARFVERAAGPTVDLRYDCVHHIRVELDSVSRLLESAPGRRPAAPPKLDDRDLCALVCPATVDVADARRRVSERLPSYPVPAIVIDAPLTARGEIDTRVPRSRAPAELLADEDAALDAPGQTPPLAADAHAVAG